ncbi:MAG: hypothetical protein GWO87_00235 [Xanthomonadaceae bacterium]|nr:hypothetical protein [Rhodospirillaceae bacterium]NIA17608.1 hypothetical protein [Xanthomonadaceae bacterium]
MLKFNRKKTKEDDDEINFESKKINSDLSEIYGDYNEEDSGMEYLEKNPKNKIAMFLKTFFSCLFIVLFLGVIGYAIFNRPQADNTKNEKTNGMVLSIEAPKTISSGGRIIYKITYENRDKVKMSKLQLLLSYPEGFIFEHASVDREQNYDNVFNLPDIEPLDKEEVEIQGRLIGKENEEKNLLASLSYEPSNFSSNFQELANASTVINSAAIGVEILGSKQILLDRDSKYLIKVKNNSDEDIENLRLLIIYPENFSAKKFGTEPDKNIKVDEVDFGVKYNVWKIERLDKGKERDFVVNGIFSGKIKNEQKMVARAEIKDMSNNYNSIAESFLIAQAIDKDIKLNLVLNGASNNQTVNLGDSLNYSIAYENKGKKDFKDVQLKMHIQSYLGDNPIDLINWESVKDENNGNVNVDAKEILWTSDNILKLSSFSAGEEGVIDFSISLKQLSDILEEIGSERGNLKIESTAEMIIGKVDETEFKMSVKSNQIISNINTDVALNAQVQYFNKDNIAIGSGPLPPKVGETTKYRVFWKVNNSLHSIKKAEIKTVLPDYVVWTNRFNKSIGELNYNEENKEVVWNIGELPITKNILQLDFEIAITPKESDLNKILVLLNKTILTAIDSETDSPISEECKPLTTDLENDPIVSGRGLVE